MLDLCFRASYHNWFEPLRILFYLAPSLIFLVHVTRNKEKTHRGLMMRKQAVWDTGIFQCAGCAPVVRRLVKNGCFRQQDWDFASSSIFVCMSQAVLIPCPVLPPFSRICHTENHFMVAPSRQILHQVVLMTSCDPESVIMRPCIDFAWPYWSPELESSAKLAVSSCWSCQARQARGWVPILIAAFCIPCTLLVSMVWAQQLFMQKLCEEKCKRFLPLTFLISSCSCLPSALWAQRPASKCGGKEAAFVDGPRRWSWWPQWTWQWYAGRT